MNKYEQLQDQAYEDGIEVIDYTFESANIKGLYCNGVIGLNKNLKTNAERSGVLAEELGHHYTTVGNIIHLDTPAKRKQERQARLWAYNKQIGLHGLISAYKAGCQSCYEVAEYLEVTEEDLQNCIHCYREKYGVCTNVDNYVICFIPHLAVFEKI